VGLTYIFIYRILLKGSNIFTILKNLALQAVKFTDAAPAQSHWRVVQAIFYTTEIQAIGVVRTLLDTPTSLYLNSIVYLFSTHKLFNTTSLIT
jgi:hypothetical protein